ncbi:MAG: MarR family transcriptional regulator [Verrucomicrobia bacterium]|nr:MarR family transcriptional regulator [Verrucomicrobiota bacterium]MCH8510366.1 MarR family transcriptional regulator [Kiritimatiellia bacterium]
MERDIVSEEERAARLRVVLWRANKAVDQVETVRLKARGLCMSDFAILEVLLHKGPLPVNTIGQKVLLTSGSITVAVRRLEDRGLLTKEVDALDRRIARVSLTEAGRELIERDYKEHVKCLREITGALNPEEQRHLYELLKKLGHHAAGLLDQG